MPMLHDTGEEYYQDKLSGETFTVGLYDDSTDNLADSDDVGAITTEPGDTNGGNVGNYQRKTATFSSSDNNNGDWRLSNDSTITFDTTNTTGTVNAAFVVVNFASEDASDGGTATDHLLFTANLDGGSVDLSNVDTFELNTLALDLS